MKDVVIQVDHQLFIFASTCPEPLSLHVILIYNLYIERWRGYLIPSKKKAPGYWIGMSGVAIDQDIYMFGGTDGQTFFNNDLWKLTRSPKGRFVWKHVAINSAAKTPSPRYYHSSWKYTGKLWIFGGFGPLLPDNFNKHGDFVHIQYMQDGNELC